MSFKDKIDSLLDEAITVSLQEKKLDPVNKKALDKDFDDRDDKDIDNDGDVDSSDEYLHNRRKAVKKAMAKEEAAAKKESSCGTMNASTLKAMALKKSMKNEDLQEKLGDDTPLSRKDADGKHQLMHKDKSIMSAIRKGMSDHEKKHMGGAYRDDTDVVHRATGKTMTSLHGKTVDQARKEIQAHIAKHHPETEKPEKAKMGSVQTVSSTRKIYTVANDSDVERIKDKYKRMGDGKYTVRPMKRKEGFKVYVDRKS